MKRNLFSLNFSLATAAALLLFLNVSGWCQPPATPQQTPTPQQAATRPQPDRIPPAAHGQSGPGLMVAGAPTSLEQELEFAKNTREYYENSANELGIAIPPEGIESLSLRQLLDFMGYQGFNPKDAVIRVSADLMASAPEGDILATRYFSPKITDVATNAAGVRWTFSYGWRKVVRFKARPGSKAAAKGITLMHVLINVFTDPNPNSSPGPGTGDPFVSQPNNQNQVILTRGEGGNAPKPIYWFVVNEINQNTGAGGKLLNFLSATFDARDPAIIGGLQKYFVPQACMQCHGEAEETGKLNYIDTDHLYDRVQAGEDFYNLRKFMNATNRSVLLDAGRIKADGGTDVTNDKLKGAMRTMHKVNDEVAQQNRRTTPPGSEPPDSFALRAVEKWISLHDPAKQDFELPKGLFERAFDKIDPSNPRQWTSSNPVDQQLLPMLNRFCYRCHSSLLWNVMDKEAVFLRARQMTFKINPLGDAPAQMPQDRRLGADTILSIQGLLEELQKQPPTP